MNDSAVDAAAPQPETRNLHRGWLLLALGVYLALVAGALLSRNGWLSALCALLLISVVLAPRLRSGQWTAWLLWLLLGSGLMLLALAGRGTLVLDLLPVAINLGLAFLFGHTLIGGRRPLIARAIAAIEGEPHLTLPRVAGYARTLTLAWTVLFVTQAALFCLLIVSGASQHSAVAALWLHLGGYLLPMLFMTLEYAFRRRYLRHLPHASLWQFLQQLARNWPRLLRDVAAPSQRQD